MANWAGCVSSVLRLSKPKQCFGIEVVGFLSTTSLWGLSCTLLQVELPYPWGQSIGLKGHRNSASMEKRLSLADRVSIWL